MPNSPGTSSKELLHFTRNNNTLILFYKKLWLLVLLVQNCLVIRSKLNILYGYSLVTRWLLVTIKHHPHPSISEVLKKSSVLHRMTLAMPILPICGMA